MIASSEVGGSLGVARLARQAVTGETAAEVFTKPARTRTIAPDPALVDLYSSRLPSYRQFYQALRPIR